MIKKYLSFINENKKTNFLNSDQYKKFIEESFSEIKEDLKDSLIDIEDLGHKIEFSYYLSNEKSEMDVNGLNLSFKVDIHINEKNNYEDLENWESHLKELKKIYHIIKDTISRFSDNTKFVKSFISQESVDFKIISILFLSNINSENLEKSYKEWLDVVSNYSDWELMDYVWDEICNYLDFDGDLRLDKKSNYIDFYLVDYNTNYDLGKIATYKIGDHIDNIKIDYSEVEYINDEITYRRE